MVGACRRSEEWAWIVKARCLRRSNGIKELEVQLKEAREKAQLFEAVVNVLEKGCGVRVVKKPLGKSSRKSSSKG